MSIRSDIRAALIAHPDGLTSEELADTCLGHELAVIALELARLRKDGFIRSTGLREGRPIYVIATWPATAEEPEEPVAPIKPPQRQEQTQMGDPKARVLKAIAAGRERRADLEDLAKGKLDEILADLLEERAIVRKGHGRGTRYVKRVNGTATPPASPCAAAPAPAPAARNGEKRTVAGYAIESGIPVPDNRGSHDTPLVQALAALKPGESIVHKTDSKSGPKSAIKSKAVAGGGGKFTVREIGDGNWRIWRLT